MKRTQLLTVLLFAVAITAATTAGAATSGQSNVTLAAAANSQVEILDATVTLPPTATDYVNDYVEAAGAAGLRVRVKSNSSSGIVLKIKCADASPQITLADLLVRTQTAPGTGGSTMSSYTAITASDQNLWSTTVKQTAWLNVTTDIKIMNINNYEDAPGGGTTNYTNTLTYTVVTQ